MILTGVQSLPSRLQCEYQTFQRQQNEILLQAVKHKCKVFLKQNTNCKKIATMLNVHVIGCIQTGFYSDLLTSIFCQSFSVYLPSLNIPVI